MVIVDLAWLCVTFSAGTEMGVTVPRALGLVIGGDYRHLPSVVTASVLVFYRWLSGHHQFSGIKNTSCPLPPLGQECWHSFTRSCSGLSARFYLRTGTHPRGRVQGHSAAWVISHAALEPLASPTADQGFLQLLEASDPVQPLPSQKSVLHSLKWTRRRC